MGLTRATGIMCGRTDDPNQTGVGQKGNSVKIGYVGRLCGTMQGCVRAHGIKYQRLRGIDPQLGGGVREEGE